MTAVETTVDGLRPPALLMQPLRLSAQKPSRLSFSRLLLTRMITERWQTTLSRIEVDDEGRGRMLYDISARDRELHAVVMTNKLPSEEQSDRAIATRWDFVLCLFDGPVDDDLLHLVSSTPPRDGGSGSDPRFARGNTRILLWVCANRSSRFFDHCVESLADGKQPDLDFLQRVGYLVRGINYVANGMMGTRMFAYLPDDHPLKSPYFAQMLGCYLVREVSCDLVSVIASRRSNQAVDLDEAVRRYIGVGNSTGIGLGLMINRHPILIDRWISLRESALAGAKAQSVAPDDAEVAELLKVIDSCILYREQDRTEHGHFTPPSLIASDLRVIRNQIQEFAELGTISGNAVEHPWHVLANAAGQLDPESEETFNSLLVEIYPESAAQLAGRQLVPETFDVVPEMLVGELREYVATDYEWALKWDLEQDGELHWLWYRTAVGGEPRLTEFTGAPREAERNVALDLIGEIKRLDHALEEANPAESVAFFLIRNRSLRLIVERVQSVIGLNYHSPHMNMFARDFIPIELGRFVLWALKGMEKPSPKNDRWIRGIMMQGTPTYREIAQGTTDDWVYPATPEIYT
jgi:hypothetical protein